MKQMMWVLVIIALLVGAFGGYYYEKSKLVSQMMMSESSLQKQVNDLKMKNETLMKEMVSPTTTPTGMMHVTPTGEMMHK